MAKIVQENVKAPTDRRAARKALLRQQLNTLNNIPAGEETPLGAEAAVMNEQIVDHMIESLKPRQKKIEQTPVAKPKPQEKKKTAVQIAREKRLEEKKRKTESATKRTGRTAAKSQAEKIAEFEESIKSELNLDLPVNTATVSKSGKQKTVIVTPPLAASNPDPEKARLLSVFGISLSIGMFIGAAIALCVTMHS